MVAFQINEHRAIGLAFPQGEVIDTEHLGRGERRGRLLAEHAQQRVAAHHHVPRVAELRPSLPPKGHAQGNQALREPQRAARPGGRHGWQAFGEDAAAAAAIAAKPFADAELEAHPILRPGQVRQGAPIVTMDTPRRSSAQRTGGAGLRRLHAQGDLRRGVVDLAGREAQHGRIG
jgi:hypothetical protein